MYNIYLVDDEPLVLEDMRGNLPWLEYNMRVVGAAQEPAAALADIAELAPDVVFTDIQMPGMSGVELIEAAQQRGAQCEFVVVSAHDKFEYARQVIRLNGFDYLVKPVEERQYTELLARLLARLERFHPHGGGPNTSSEELNAIAQYLERNIAQKHSLGALGQRFGLSPNHICSLFSRHLGTTFSTYMTRLRMERAGEYLLRTQKPVKEIAAECGYGDYFYFCRVFREYHGCTPTQHRGGGQ